MVKFLIKSNTEETQLNSSHLGQTHSQPYTGWEKVEIVKMWNKRESLSPTPSAAPGVLARASRQTEMKGAQAGEEEMEEPCRQSTCSCTEKT